MAHGPGGPHPSRLAPQKPGGLLCATPFDIPEAVEEVFFAASSEAGPNVRVARSDAQDPVRDIQSPTSDTRDQTSEPWDPVTGSQHPGATPASVGVYLRPSVKNIVEQTMHRLQRTREDIIWNLFDTPTAPDEMRTISVWVDPAIDAEDYDGFTAEALVSGRVVVASRTAINLKRTEKGRTALLVPANDSNELTHAILTALFKPEVGQERALAAQQTISKFRPRQRHRALTALYESLFP